LKLDERKEERENKKLRYEIDTAMPQLAAAGDARVEKFNQAVTNLVAPRTGEFMKVADETAREEAAANQDAKSSLPPNSLSVSYEVTAANKDFISVLFSFYEYLGGAHPNTITESFNYDLNRNAPVSLADLFTPNSNYLKVISDYAIKELKKLDTVSGVENGAGPKIENFHSWNITPAGLKITFDPYQVGPYAAGAHEVVVPYSVLKPIIRQDGLLAQFSN
jgi:peptidoglycan-N-acetylglucosamine deacetylase